MSRVSPPLASSSTPFGRAIATDSRSSSRLMLSQRIRSAPAVTASATWATVSHSTSTGRPGNLARTAANAAATPPAATTWLSFTSAASASDIRWLRPPPQRTAYFSNARSPGRVLRVSRIAAPVPSTASTHRRVAVATPERWHSRFSAVRSAVSRARTGPATVRTASPGLTWSPSEATISMSRPPVQPLSASACSSAAASPRWTSDGSRVGRTPVGSCRAG